MTSDFDNFLSSIDWVAPKPTTFRINLKNDQDFYLEWNGRSWVAIVLGKRYYLLNLAEEQHAIEAIARILRYGPKESKDEETVSTDTSIEATPAEEEAPEEEI